MASNTNKTNTSRVAEMMRSQKDREGTYRERALKLYPWICGHCCREFTSKNLRELTVHHKDHNHDNNPPDGTNWELLCIYCHDNEHSRDQVADAYDTTSSAKSSDSDSDNDFTDNPFAGLSNLIKD
ncbi:MAG: HNH nuclease family protein [Desulfobacterium sp.]|nr:HNH nuclease family protein [Desulfobacterium sp.]